KKYKVTASMGHVRDLPKSQMGVDVDNNYALKYITIRGKGETLKELRKEAKKAKRINLAADHDREGEDIEWHQAQALNVDVDAENNYALKYISISGKGETLKELRKEAKKAKRIYLAADADREGEAIAWHLAQALNVDVDSDCRVVFNEITKDAIKESFKHPR